MVTPESTNQTVFPEITRVQVMGEHAHRHAPLHPARLLKPLLTRRLLHVCRKAPKSGEELAKALQADRVYVEDIIPDLVAAEVLREEASGTYIAPFPFATREEHEALHRSVPAAEEGSPVIRKHLPGLSGAVEQTTMVRDQGCDWRCLSWIALLSWLHHSIHRHLDRLPTWGRRRINIKPVRPVDNWYLIGRTQTSSLKYARGATRMGSENGTGTLHVEGWPSKEQPPWPLNAGHRDRYLGHLCRGSRTETGLIEDSEDRDAERERLARLIEAEIIIKTDDRRFRLNMPVVNTEDDEMLVEIIDPMAIECVETFIDRSLTSFSEKVESLGFGHLMTQPGYIGFIGVQRIIDMMIRACVADGILVEPESPARKFGFHAWYESPHLMRKGENH